MTMKAKHSNPWRSSARGTQTRMMSDRMQPRLHAVFPACSHSGVFPERSEDALPNSLARGATTGSCPFLPQPSSNQLPSPTRPGKVSVFTPFCEKLFELYSEIKIYTCTKFIKPLKWFVFYWWTLVLNPMIKLSFEWNFHPFFPFSPSSFPSRTPLYCDLCTSC